MADSCFGRCIALDGDTAIIGAYHEDHYYGSNSGAAYVFVKSGSTWVQKMRLLPSDGQAGDLFGCAVSLDGGITVIGARGANDAGNNSGAAYVFTYNGITWEQTAKLLASDGVAGNAFGQNLGLNNGTVVIGAPYANDSQVLRSGAAYIFTVVPPNKLPHPAFSWSPQYPFPHEQTTFDASASYDNDGSIVKYEWDWNHDGVYDENHTTPTAVHSWVHSGGYLVTLRVTDNVGGIAVLTKDVKVRYFPWADHV
ncbi:MAG: PKD domain-containing protein [Methanobacteriota archaeon]